MLILSVLIKKTRTCLGETKAHKLKVNRKIYFCKRMSAIFSYISEKNVFLLPESSLPRGIMTHFIPKGP